MSQRDHHSELGTLKSSGRCIVPFGLDRDGALCVEDDDGLCVD